MFRIRTVLAGVVVAAAAVLMVAAPASAHDQLVSSTPAAGSEVTTVPEQVVLTFSNNVLSLSDNSGTAMTVVGADGTDWVGGDPAILADTVTVPLKPGMPNGAYDVTWKIVSADGHPTSGEFSFTLAAPEPAPTASTAPSASASPSATPSQIPAPAPSQTSALQWPLLIGLGVVLLIAIILVIVFASRKKR
ncbi:copper resistance CopC family protein [Microbacterium sp.]|uniref:copper resistance CopC family protein n=1 Tax=Microbacterium sp. TaxID=51671 RepID=UPI003A95B338